MPNTQTIKFAGIRTSGIQPSGTINLTNTSLTDVSQYQYAQIVDSNLLAANIKSGVSVLGVTGSYTGSGDPTYYAQRLVEGSLNTISEETIGRPSNISNQCFINRSIYDLDLPSSVTAIYSAAFSGCTFYNPTHFNLGSSLVNIDSGAFAETTFSNISEEYIISIPNSVTTIGNGNFNISNTNVKFKMSENISYLGASSFNQDENYTHGLTNINGVYYLDGNTTSHIAAIKSNNKGADIASGTKVIAFDCFKNSAVSILGIPESVISFGGFLSPKYPDIYYAGDTLPSGISSRLGSEYPISKIHLNATSKTYSFNTNGADTATPASYTGIILPDSAAPANPTKTGKYFWGWYDTDWTNDTDGLLAVKFPLYRASTTTFNARWEDTQKEDGLSEETAIAVTLGQNTLTKLVDKSSNHFVFKFTPTESGEYDIYLNDEIDDEAIVVTDGTIGNRPHWSDYTNETYTKHYGKDGVAANNQYWIYYQYTNGNWEDATNQSKTTISLTANTVYYIVVGTYEYLTGSASEEYSSYNFSEDTPRVMTITKEAE